LGALGSTFRMCSYVEACTSSDNISPWLSTSNAYACSLWQKPTPRGACVDGPCSGSYCPRAGKRRSQRRPRGCQARRPAAPRSLNVFCLSFRPPVPHSPFDSRCQATSARASAGNEAGSFDSLRAVRGVRSGCLCWGRSRLKERVPKCRVCRPARVPLEVVKKSRPPRGWCAAPPPRLTAPEGLLRWARGGSGRLRALRVGGSGRPPEACHSSSPARARECSPLN